jgi:myosin-5
VAVWLLCVCVAVPYFQLNSRKMKKGAIGLASAAAAAAAGGGGGRPQGSAAGSGSAQGPAAAGKSSAQEEKNSQAHELLHSTCTHVFIDDEEDLFAPALIIERDEAANQLTVQDLRNEDRVVTVATENTYPIGSLEELEDPPTDLILLSIVHRPAILHTLRSRFFEDQIYTNVGAILVSINPFKKIQGLYSTEVMQQFSLTVTDRPHVFAVARDAYDGVKRGKNQSLIISGESGAGKTEATKQGLSYLAHVAGSSSGVQEKILLSSPILEAWGNAKTNRNDNSSRFGKFIEVWFGKYSDIVGASTTTYLLEKSRVVFQEENERNYHVFYQLLFGADEALLQTLKLTKFAENPASVALINQSGCVQMDSIDDRSDYEAVQHALISLGFSPEEVMNMSRVISGVLNFGNVEILPPNETDRCTLSAPSSEWFANTVDMWKVETTLMLQSMFVRTVSVKSSKRSSFVLTPLSHAAAIENRNSLAKEIYSRCFDWIVDKINSAMGVPASSMGSIGVLDIFGFEIFKKVSTHCFSTFCALENCLIACCFDRTLWNNYASIWLTKRCSKTLISIFSKPKWNFTSLKI